MQNIQQDKIVIFGAGKIGRSFIGQLFSRGGYEVVFADVYKPIIDELNRRGCYKVIIKSEKDQILNISRVRGVWANDIQSVAGEIATAGIVSVSVGLNGLEGIFQTLAAGLIQRHQIHGLAPLDIIIAENMRDADAFFRDRLIRLLPVDFPFRQVVGLVETSIGKMVPIMLKKDLDEDILQVFAEPYNTLILDQKAFRNPIPRVDGLLPRENMKAWVDRKLFIHNLGHATAAYLGYVFNPGFVYLYEALAVPSIFNEVRATMLQSADILSNIYPGEFTGDDLSDHIDDLLSRFQNRALGDTIFRVGCDLPRKLGPEDRLSGAIRAAIRLHLPYDKILFALVCSFHFRATDESGNRLPEDEKFRQVVEKGIYHVLESVCGFDPIENIRLFEEAQSFELLITK